jgi:plastocyanin
MQEFMCIPLVRFGLALALVACGAQAQAQAIVEGVVKLPKASAPPAKPPRYQGQVGEIAPPEAPTAVVYLEGSFQAGSNAAPKVELWQRGLQFRPALLPVQVGTAVEFPNGDEIYHNVFSYSKVKRFDLGRYRKDEKPAMQVFDKPGVVKLYCEIHEHMRGTILVLDTPYFVRTDTNGAYRLKDLPAGQYTLKAWVDEKQIYEQPVTLAAGQTQTVNFPAK